jgi:tol-pal system protein YbgF
MPGVKRPRDAKIMAIILDKNVTDKTMKNMGYKSYFTLKGWLIILLSFFLSSCVYDQEFAYTNDQINALNKKTSQLQDSIDDKLTGINSNQAELMVEMGSLRDNIRDLSGRIEDNEYILKNVVEKDLTEQDAIRADLAKLADLTQRIEKLETALKQQQEYLGLESIDVMEPQEGQEDEVNEEGLQEGQTIEESEQYNYAYSLYRDEEYEQASEVFKGFLNDYPDSELADNAQFWIGECLMAQEQYEQAILAYNDVIKKYPEGNKVPNAMWRQAIAFLEINDNTSSKLLLNKIIKQFPDSDEAKLAQTKLNSMK